MHRTGPQDDETPVLGANQTDLNIKLSGQIGSLACSCRWGRVTGWTLCLSAASQPVPSCLARLSGQAGQGATLPGIMAMLLS